MTIFLLRILLLLSIGLVSCETKTRVKFLFPDDFCLQPSKGKVLDFIDEFNAQSTASFIDVTVQKSLLTPDVIGSYTRTEFEAEVKSQFGTVNKDSPRIYDMSFVFELFMPEIAEGQSKKNPDGLVDLTEFLKGQDFYSDFFKTVKLDLATYRGVTYGVPLDMDWLTVMVREDLLQEAFADGIIPGSEPKTWEELANLSDHFHGKERDNHTLWGTCYATTSMRKKMKELVWASYVQTLEQTGVWFDPADFSTFFSTPAMTKVASLLKRLILKRKDEVNKQLPETFYLKPSRDDCAIFFGHGPKGIYDTSPERFFKPLPGLGSREVWSRTEKKMVAAPEVANPFPLSYPDDSFKGVNAPQLIGGHWNMAISNHASNETRDAAFEFIAWIQNSTGGENSTSYRFMKENACLDPWSRIHIKPLSADLDAYNDAKTKLTLDVLNTDNVFTPLRITTGTQYTNFFDDLIERYIQGDIVDISIDGGANLTAEALLLDKAFDDLTTQANELYGDELWQHNLYRKTLGLATVTAADLAAGEEVNTVLIVILTLVVFLVLAPIVVILLRKYGNIATSLFRSVALEVGVILLAIVMDVGDIVTDIITAKLVISEPLYHNWHTLYLVFTVFAASSGVIGVLFQIYLLYCVFKENRHTQIQDFSAEELIQNEYKRKLKAAYVKLFVLVMEDVPMIALNLDLIFSLMISTVNDVSYLRCPVAVGFSLCVSFTMAGIKMGGVPKLTADLRAYRKRTGDNAEDSKVTKGRTGSLSWTKKSEKVPENGQPGLFQI